MTTSFLERRQLKKELYTFLIITFTATYILDFAIYLISGPISSEPSKLWDITLQCVMFIPATVAMFCMYCFKSYALNKETKIIFMVFLLFVVSYSFENYYQPIIGTIMGLPIVSMIIVVLGFLSVIILNLFWKSREELEPSKLAVGKNLRYYIIMPLVLSAILIVSFTLNYVSGLGVPAVMFNLNLFFNSLIVNLIFAFFISWPLYFGEEYGWRIYLQDRLFPLLGGYKGVLILGVIWGLWHVPIITFGYNYPGQPILGNISMILFTIVLGIIFSYAVLKTGSVWIAAILHFIVNTISPIALLFIANSINPILSFGLGIYGIIILASFALILLRSKVWKR